MIDYDGVDKINKNLDSTLNTLDSIDKSLTNIENKILNI